MRPLRIAIIGYGKIAADQHAPAIAANPRFELAATVSRGGKGAEGVPSFTSTEALLDAGLLLDAVAITTPPDARHAIASPCIAAGVHVLLEKPPAVTLGEAEDMVRTAEQAGVTLFATWHAQANPAVAALREHLAAKRLRRLRVTWREDVRKWHPDQDWIWEPGGFGVFDPGINALSILTYAIPGPLFVEAAEIDVPQGRQTPIAARLQLGGPALTEAAELDFDWRETGEERWEIEAEDEAGAHYLLTGGGAQLCLNGAPVPLEPGAGEYPALYARFLDSIDCRQSEADLSPLRLVADALLLARRREVEPFA